MYVEYRIDLHGHGELTSKEYSIYFEALDKETHDTIMEVEIPIGDPSHFTYREHIQNLIKDLQKLLDDHDRHDYADFSTLKRS